MTIARPRISIAIQTPEVVTMMELIAEADRLGIPGAWATTAGIRPDSLTVFAAAAVKTTQIVLGSAIVPTWPRNPIFLVQQVQALEGLAAGRFRIGIGPSTEAAMRPFGIAYGRPLRQLREYLTVVRTLLHEGSVDFSGELVRARARIPQTFATPILISALQEGGFALAGELSDGAITWMCPLSYVREVGVPTLQHAAEAAGREPPPIVLHTPVCVESDPEVARAAVQKHLGAYGRFQFYADMFAKAGFPDAANGLSQSLVDDLAIYGSEEEVSAKLIERASGNIAEVMAQVLPVGPDERESVGRTLAAIARAAQELS